ncbi:RNA-binding protein Pasilla-like isoform X2 [Tubulanus polymorphus]|uniref:RNA-binding protein Pasilla-like isoform X2 n=1 Tax=Tubulanus polymorphus TaxID=672921 RepID=UPI003DA25D8B
MAQNVTAMETSDSRKRPLDGEIDSGVTKRSNPGGEMADSDHVHFKILIPSIAAGAIIGKGGETIAHKQKDTGARIKMSKANDFYPGTSERICLITGTVEAITVMHNFITEKILEKPDPNPKPAEGEVKVKILVPNSTAGMIIGKGGNYINQIKEESGAYVQISQKSKDVNLPERCVTVSGDMESNRKAVALILQKIAEDPQSASCPNISYADVTGPVASANPTGSPFAQTQPASRADAPPNVVACGNNLSNTIGAGINNLNLNTSMAGAAGMFGAGAMNVNNFSLEQLKATLRGSGYSEQAADEISAAMCTLASYGLMGMGMSVGQQGSFSLNLGGGTGLGGLNLGSGPGSFGNANNLGNPSSAGMDTGSGMFGPVGSGSSAMGGQTAAASASLFSNAANNPEANSASMFTEYNTGPYSQGFAGTGDSLNQNSFGLGPCTSFQGPGGDDKSNKREIEVADNLVGVILGPGGKGIVELQHFTGANIQISKKGVYAPGTRNRIVTITGNPENVSRAHFLIQQKLQQEEARRRQNPVH